MKPRLQVVQTPAPAGVPRSYKFDASRPAPNTEMLRATWADGETTGFRVGYIQGWRWGLLCGATVAAAGAGAALLVWLKWWA